MSKNGIDLTVRRGQVFGFLGPNGAGKTTTIRILATLTRPDGGTARVLGFDAVTERNAIRARAAVTGQFASLDNDLTGYENLIVLGRLRGLSRAASEQRADELLAAFDLTGSASRPVGGYSGGMRRRHHQPRRAGGSPPRRPARPSGPPPRRSARRLSDLRVAGHARDQART
jgi:ABC-2 type transport system ATP-binding protein